MGRVINKAKQISNDILRIPTIIKNKRALQNRDFSLISNNCLGGILLHELDMKFNSPFINLSIPDYDYIKMLKNFKDYMQLPLICVRDTVPPRGYPIGKINGPNGDVVLKFIHYKSFDEANEKWTERKSRINYDNLFVVMTCINAVSESLINEFEQLPFDNKIMFLNYKNDYKYCRYIKGFEDKDGLGFLWDYSSFGKKYYDQFDFVNWFNFKG